MVAPYTRPLIDPTDPEQRYDALPPTLRDRLFQEADPLTQEAMNLEQSIREATLAEAGAERLAENYEAGGDDYNAARHAAAERYWRELKEIHERRLRQVRNQIAEQAAARLAAE